MRKRKKKVNRNPRHRPDQGDQRPAKRAAESRRRARPRPQPDLPDGDKPRWNAEEGNLYWRGRLVMHLASQAHAERAVLDKFEIFNWRFVVKNPLSRDEAGIGDPTARRRNAIRNLMLHQGDIPVIQFFSVLDGFVAWCPCKWLVD